MSCHHGIGGDCTLCMKERNAQASKTKPSHYGFMVKGVEVDALDLIQALAMDFNLGNVVKYVVRAGRKPGETALDDLRKAREYLDRRIAYLEKLPPAPCSVADSVSSWRR